MTDEGLGQTGIDTIHRHMVTIVRGPSQCKLTKVASTDHKSSKLIAEVHEYLSALTSLTVLVCHVMYVDVMIDVEEMLLHTLTDAYLAYGDAKALHKRYGIIIGTVCGAESGHRDAYYSLTVVAKLVEGHGTYEEGKSGIKSAAYAKDHSLAVGMDETLCQTAHLDGEYLVACLVHHI